jgi:hypothetical protein
MFMFIILHHCGESPKAEEVAMSSNAVKKESSNVRFSVSVPQPLHDELERTAKQNDASIAWVVRKAVTQYLGKSAASQNPDRRVQ